MFSPERVDPVVDLLVELAGDGRALELAIGTGRIAVPLAQRGVPVHGIELSQAMAARLREKPEAKEIGVTIGDFTSAKADGTFTVAYLVFNTIQNVLRRPSRWRPSATPPRTSSPAAASSSRWGFPDLQRLPPGETSRPFNLSADHVGLDEYDVANQGLRSHHFSLVDGTWQYLTIPFRYVWPSELDLMAELAGMRLRDRWADWNREPFTSESRKHVSVWEKPR